MNKLKQAISAGIAFLSDRNVDVPADVWSKALRSGVLKAEGQDLADVKGTYHDTITQALIDYFEGAGSIAGPRNSFKRAAIESLGAAFDQGWQDAGGELPPDGDGLEWFNARAEQELSFIDELFQQAKELRKEEDFDYFTWISQRADGYTATVTAVYNAGKMYAGGNIMLTWRYGQAEHCDTCLHLNGQRHRASWYLARNYIPHKPGAAMDCHGDNCKCDLVDDNGDIFTI
jgi:hypothetical protein